jgi:hypothetical protein
MVPVPILELSVPINLRVPGPLEYLFHKKELVQMFEDFKQIKMMLFFMNCKLR